MFAFYKLFGSKEKSKTDLENEGAGKETTIDRTRPLFYGGLNRSRGKHLSSNGRGYVVEIWNRFLFMDEALRLGSTQEQSHEHDNSHGFTAASTHDRGYAVAQTLRNDADPLYSSRPTAGSLPWADRKSVV